MERTANEIPDLKPLLINSIRGGWADDSWEGKKEVPPWWLGYLALFSYYPNDPEQLNVDLQSYEGEWELTRQDFASINTSLDIMKKAQEE